MKQTDDIRVGDTLRVQGFAQGESDYKRKLLAMGLTKGTVIEVTGIAPLGDPLELEVRGYHLTLRRHEASMLILEDVL